MNHYDCPHGNTKKFCRSCDLDTLRRDLATRDRELAEGRQQRDFLSRERKEAKEAWLRAEFERDQARAALADAQQTLRYRDVELVRERDKLAAAQEEAKGPRAALVELQRLANGPLSDRRLYQLVLAITGNALAARQQQPDGKPETLRDHVARHKEGDEGP